MVVVVEESFKKIHFVPAQCCVLLSLAIFKQGTVWSYSREGVVVVVGIPAVQLLSANTVKC